MLWQFHFNEIVNACTAEELQSSLSLSLPKLSICIDDSVSCTRVSIGQVQLLLLGEKGITKEIPRTPLKHVAFAEESFVLQDIFQILGVVDDNSRRQSWNRDLIGLQAEASLTTNKPVKECVPRLKEANSIA